MKFNVELELTEREYKYLCSHSIERVFNTAIEVAEKSKHHNAELSIDDLEEMKPIARNIWTSTHSAIFTELNPALFKKD